MPQNAGTFVLKAMKKLSLLNILHFGTLVGGKEDVT